MKETIQKRPKLLWIKSDQLHPLNSGGKIRTFNMLTQLKKSFEVTYFCMGDSSDTERRKMLAYCDYQQVEKAPQTRLGAISEFIGLTRSILFSRLPYAIDKYTNRRLQTSLNKILCDYDYDVVVCDFLTMSANILGLPRRRNAKYILFQHNVESRIWQRLYENAQNPIRRAIYKSQWSRFMKYEPFACDRFDGVVAVSEKDADDFQSNFGICSLKGHVETGVDLEFFSSNTRAQSNLNIVFLGSMDWTPNINGILEFVDFCYPQIKTRVPDVTLTIVGRKPAPAVVRLAENDGSIQVTGTVDDVRPYLEESALAIVPLKVGGGTRIKIYEAMAMGLPVISTSVGAEGLPVRDGESIVIADDWDTFASDTSDLLKNPEFANRIAEQGRKLVRDNYSWERVTREFVRLIDEVQIGSASEQNRTCMGKES